MSFEIEVNKKIIRVKKGETILSALKRNGIVVPTLCNLKELNPTGGCRLCVVEVEGEENLVPACSYPINQWLRVKTHSPRVIQARRTLVELLLANHPNDCLYCIRNGSCELQNLAKELNINERRFFGEHTFHKIDRSSPAIVKDLEKCILCNRCIRVCEEIQTVSAIDRIGRGGQSAVGPEFNNGLNVSTCVACGQCVVACPTGALHEKENTFQIKDAINDPKKHVVVQYDPTISVSIASEFGLKPGKDINGILNAALRIIGFNKVFTTAFGNDLQIIELAHQLKQNMSQKNAKALISSCCPSWRSFVDQFFPEYKDLLSDLKSGQQILGAIIKTYYADIMQIDPANIFTVSITPCTARKLEAEEYMINGFNEVDAAITTRELASFIKMHGINLNDIEEELSDLPFGMRSSAGKLSAVAGGLTEGLMRTFHFTYGGKEINGNKIQELRSGNGFREYEAKLNGKKIKCVAVNGLSNARILMDNIRSGKAKYDFIEVMACPKGCVSGGGQPVSSLDSRTKIRIKSIYELDSVASIRQAHKNPGILEIYKKLLIEAGGEKSKELFCIKKN
ncbi:MAG: (2Fe-2S)-binding protein [Bacteroidales bacterium]|nr:(2Fe-2S)-binding protein [Bacteroidales bacterium]